MINMVDHLSIKEIDDRLKEVPGWEMISHTEISKEFEFRDFKGAIDFVQKVGESASHEYHYPDILIRNNKVTLTLTTHDENALTYKDFKMAKIIEQLI